MPDNENTLNPALVLAHARAWVGTPFIRRGDLRGAGADCIGLVRGIYRELTGRTVAAPAWRDDWPLEPTEQILDGLSAHAVRVPKDTVSGRIVTFRIGHKRAAHVAILTDAGSIHAWEVGGVKETAPFYGREITSAWALPCPEGCVSGRPNLTADQCLAVIYPHENGPYAEITDMIDATPLARTPHYRDVAQALNHLGPIYTHIETME
ncbi:MAG: hypothetical protein AAGL96_18000 [Pseudomonadota bacterium]